MSSCSSGNRLDSHFYITVFDGTYREVWAERKNLLHIEETNDMSQSDTDVILPHAQSRNP